MKLIKRSRISNDSRRSVTSGRFAFLLGICCILVGLHTTWSYAEDKVVELTFTFWGSPFEKQAIEKLVPRIIDRIAIKVGSEFAEKWTARAIPILSAGAGGTLNYYFVRAWGRRAQKHFIEKHRHARRKKLGNPVAFPAPPALLDS